MESFEPLLYKTSGLQLLQALPSNDQEKRIVFCGYILKMMVDDRFLQCIIFSDKASYHFSGKVNGHNV